MHRSSPYYISLILGAFAALALVLRISASSSYVPAPGSYLKSTLAFSILCFAGLIALISHLKGTDRAPLGFRLFFSLWRDGKWATCIKMALALPLASALLGGVLAAVAVSVPAYPTLWLSTSKYSVAATCMESGRDKLRGRWSLLRLPSGEEWKVAGFGHICPTAARNCRLHYLQGSFGVYVTDLECRG